MRGRRTSRHPIVRRLRFRDQDDICDHFLRLDDQTRRERFCGTVTNTGVLGYAQNVLRYDSIACGAFISGQLRGLVELRGLFQSWQSKTEAAFSVEAEWQGVGIGEALFQRMFVMAQNRGVRTIQMMCLKENHHMRYLAAKHNAQFVADADIMEAILRPNWPTPASIAIEIIAETRAYSHLLFS